MNKYEQPIYAGFRRLRPFPLDPTSQYEKFSDLLDYLNNDRTTAYLGQVVSVYNDEDLENNSIYIVSSLSKEISVEARLTKLVNVTKFNNGLAIITKRLDDIDGTLEIHKDDIDKLKQELPNYLTIDAFNSAKKELNDAIAAIDKENDDLVKQSDFSKEIERLDSRVDNILGEEYDTIKETLNDISEISKWISEHEDLLGTLEKLDHILEGIEENVQKQIDDVTKQVADLDIETQSKINDLTDRLDNIKDEIELDTSCEKIIEIPFYINRRTTNFASRIGSTRNKILKDSVIKEVRINIDDFLDGMPQNKFELSFIKNTGGKEVLVSDSADNSLYDEDMLEAIGILERQIDFSNSKVNILQFLLNYRVTEDGYPSLYIEIPYGDIDDVLAGTVYLTYFYNKNNE